MEEPKRLPPTPETLRRLYVLSGNQCAFPGCDHPLFNNQGNFVAQICHIEAAMPGGERFNKNMSNEERRSFENLILMCYPHHIETNKEHIYTTEKLKAIKAEHERIFSDIDGAVAKISSSIIDYTTLQKPTEAKSLRRLMTSLYGSDQRSPEEVSSDLRDFNDGIKDFALLSPDARRYFSISLSRAKNEMGIYGRNTGKIYFDPFEIQRVTNIQNHTSFSLINELESAGFIAPRETYNGREWPYFVFQNSECNFWELIHEFCKKENLKISELVYDMKFAILD